MASFKRGDRPGYSQGWAVLGEIFIAGVFMGYKTQGIDHAIEESIVCGRKALKLDPQCQHANQTLGLGYLFSQNKHEALKIVSEYIRQDLPVSGVMGAMAFCLICCGEYDRGIKMLDESIQLNPYYQWWLNGGISFYYFHKKDYDEAIYWAEKINIPHIPWEQLLKIASLVELNKMEDAAKNYRITIKQFLILREMLSEYLNAFILDKTHIRNGVRLKQRNFGNVLIAVQLFEGQLRNGMLSLVATNRKGGYKPQHDLAKRKTLRIAGSSIHILSLSRNLGTWLTHGRLTKKS